MCGRTREEKHRRDEKVASMAATHRCKGVVSSRGWKKGAERKQWRLYQIPVSTLSLALTAIRLPRRPYKNIARIVLAQVSISSQPLKVPAVFATCIFVQRKPAPVHPVSHSFANYSFSIFTCYFVALQTHIILLLLNSKLSDAWSFCYGSRDFSFSYNHTSSFCNV